MSPIGGISKALNDPEVQQALQNTSDGGMSLTMFYLLVGIIGTFGMYLVYKWIFS